MFTYTSRHRTVVNDDDDYDDAAAAAAGDTGIGVARIFSGGALDDLF